MVTYYRDEAVLVTASTIEVDGKRYPLDRLGYVWYRRKRRLARGGYVLATRIGTVVLAVTLLVGAAVALALADFGAYTWHVLTAVALVVTVLAALAGFGVDPLLELLDRSHETGHGVHEIWARSGGAEILLFSTTDTLRFGKVYRALQRAIERTGDGGSARGRGRSPA